MIPLLLYELLVFGAIQLFGLLVGYKLMNSEQFIPTTIHFSSIDFIAAFLIATVFFVVFLKFLRGATLFKLMFVFIILIGSKAAFSAFFSNIVASILTLFVLIVWLAFPYVLTHNLIILTSISGISASIGLGLAPGAIITALAVLSMYDVIAVYKTKHMVTMFNKLLEKGVIMSIIIPRNPRATISKIKEIRPGQQSGFMLLGTGDIALPLVFAISVMKISLMSSFFVIGGSLLGVIIVNQLLVEQSERRAIPALPPIALCSILGFLLSTLI